MSKNLIHGSALWVLMFSAIPMSSASAATGEAAPTADAATPNSGEIGDIIVSARRRSETSQTVPIAVTAISGAQLQAQAAVDVRDVARVAPNVSIGQVSAGANAAAVSIRGISFDDVEKSFDPAVGVLIDGVYLGTNTGALAHAFDFDTVEVLRGPQGILFGRNTIGGVINIRRTRPTGELGLNANLTVGNRGRFDANAVVNLPSLGDVLSTKLFYQRSESGGIYHNATRDVNEPKDKFQGFGAAFLFSPSSSFDYLLTVERQVDNGQIAYAPLSDANSDVICQIPAAFGGSPAAECGRNNTDDLYTTFSNQPSSYRYALNAITGEGTWKLGDGITLTSVTGYQRTKERIFIDFDASSAEVFSVLRRQKYRQFSQELRLSGNLTDSLDFVTGLYYFDSRYTLLADYTVFGGPSPAPNGDGSAKSYAAFGDIDWAFAQGWRLSVGGRYTKDKKSLNLIGLTGGEISDDWARFTPKVSVDWRPVPEALLYGSYSRGYRSGGFNSRAGSPTSAQTPYDPETVTTYEVGAKTDWFDRHLRVNLALFYSDFKNKQEEVVRAAPPPTLQETVVFNAASAEIKGLELEVVARPTDGLTLRGSLGLLDAKYKSFRQCDPNFPATCTIVDVSSRNLRRAPKTSASVGFEYQIPSSLGDWTLSADYSHTSPYDLTIVPQVGNLQRNDPRCRTDGQDSVNASIAWKGEAGLRASLWGRNLLDDRGLNYCLPVGATGAAGATNFFTFANGRTPRTYGVTLGYSF